MASGGHPNIVTVLQHGWLPDDRYYYDMELCFLSLEDYIRGNVNVVFGLSKYFEPISAKDILGCLSLWGIMKHIVNGLHFIHLHGELHRDFKPRNGIHYLNHAYIE